MNIAEVVFMQRAIQLATYGAGKVAPNPMVGAVLTYNDQIIGEGFHEVYGGPHAEVNCINNVLPENKHLIAQSHLYVSLEPCNHYGKTPPCTEWIIKHKIPTVTVGCTDSYAKVNGAGLQRLREAGIQVNLSGGQGSCFELNRRFFTFHKKQRPYIILKWAQSINGLIAPDNNERMQISGFATQRLVHKWRTEEAAILIGARTSVIDNPQLNARLWPGRSPLRLVWDANLKTPMTHHLHCDDEATVFFNKIKSTVTRKKMWVQLKEENFLRETLEWLYQQNILSVLVEGGAQVLQHFISSSIWDECRILQGNLTIESGVEAPRIQHAKLIDKYQIGEDGVQVYRHVQHV